MRVVPVLLMSLAVAGCRDNPPEEPMEVGGGGAVTLWTDSTELFMEYPALIIGQAEKFAVHLTDATDYAALRGGSVVFEFRPRDGGEPVVVRQDAPRAPGIYGPAPRFTRPGVYDLTILIDTEQIRDTVRVPGLTVYESVALTPAPEAGDAGGGIAFLKEQQWKTPGFRTDFADSGAVAASVRAPGEIIPAAGRLANISAPVPGIIDPGGLTGAPTPGTPVRRGQRLATLAAAITESGSVLAAARRELREAEDEFARAQRLLAAEAIPPRRLHEAEGRLAAARETMAGLGGAATDSAGRLEIRSPFDGVVVERRIAPGSRVEAGTHLFTVVDPSVVWLRIRVPALDATRVRGTAGAWFRLEGDTTPYRTTRVLSFSPMLDSATRTLPLLFEVTNPAGRIPIGALAETGIATRDRETGIRIPLSAILDEDGRPIAFVQTSGERFQRRELILGAVDGTHAIVQSGIAAGERVVTGAAPQVRLASLSTAVPEHGHEH